VINPSEGSLLFPDFVSPTTQDLKHIWEDTSKYFFSCLYMIMYKMVHQNL
jgi:hypothetical protein